MSERHERMASERYEGSRQCAGCYRSFAYYELDECGECHRCRDEREADDIRGQMENELRQWEEDLSW